MTCSSSRRWNLSHKGSAGARADFQRLNGPQCSVGFKGFVWVSDCIEKLLWNACKPSAWAMLQSIITGWSWLSTRFCLPPSSNAFCSRTRVLIRDCPHALQLAGVELGEGWLLSEKGNASRANAAAGYQSLFFTLFFKWQNWNRERGDATCSCMIPGLLYFSDITTVSG